MTMTHTQSDTNTTTPHKTPGVLAWFVWGLGCAFYFYEFLLQVSPNVMGSELMRDFGISAHTLGFLSAAYFYAYSPMQIPVGILLDRYGPQRCLTVAAAVCGLSSIIFALTHHFYAAMIARFFVGAGSAFAVIGCMKLAANWFRTERFALLVGIIVTIGMLGAISGESPLALLIHAIGWRYSMLIFGVVGLILSLLIMLVVQDYPPHKKPEVSHATQAPLWEGLKQILKIKQLWLVAVYGGLMYMPTITLAGLWGGPYLMHKFDISRPAAGAVISVMFVGWVAASSFWGWWSGYIGKRLPPMIIASIGSLITLALALYLPNINLFTMEVLLFLFGVFSCGFLPSFSIAKEICSSHYTATSLAFMNMMNMLGVAIAQPLVGKILDMLWDGTTENGVRIYSTANYEVALSITVVGIALALVLLPFIKETYCRAVD